MSLKIIFAGTPEFAVPTLQKLLNSEHIVVAAYTQPDRPAGRGQQLQASAVKRLAQLHHLPIFQPKKLRDENVLQTMRALQADVMVVVAYGLILPETVLHIPRLGCINVHPSLLPRWRGAAPIARTIEAGDLESGVTIMQMDKGMDTGSILQQEKYFLSGEETSQSLHDLFSKTGAELLYQTVQALEHGTVVPIPQNNDNVSHAAKLEKAEAIIDWHQSAVKIANKVRAYNSWPVANTIFQQAVLKIWAAQAIGEKTTLMPGVIVRIEKEALLVATGEGILKIHAVQLPAKKRISAADFINANAANLQPEKTKLG